MNLTTGQKFFLGVLMITPSNMRAKLDNALGGSQDLQEFETAFNSVADASLGFSVSQSMEQNDYRPLQQLYLKKDAVSSRDLLSLIGYSGTSCPTTLDQQQILSWMGSYTMDQGVAG